MGLEALAYSGMSTLESSAEVTQNLDAGLTALATFMSDMRQILQEHRNGIREELDTWSSKQETFLTNWCQALNSTRVGSMTACIGSNLVSDSSSQEVTSRKLSNSSQEVTDRFSRTMVQTRSSHMPSVRSENSVQPSRSQHMRRTAVERAGWRRAGKSRSRLERSKTSGQSGGAEPPKKKCSVKNVDRWDADRVAVNVFVDRERDSIFGDEISGDWAGYRTTSSRAMLGYYGSFRKNLRAVIKSWPFDILCGVLIIANAVLLWVEVDFLARTGTVPCLANGIQTVLNVWYCLELFLRWWAAPKRFCAPEEWRWNAVDVFTIIPSILDLAAEALKVTNSTMLRIFRSLRILRIIRLLRIAKQLTYVRVFRKMAFSLLSSTQTLIWSVLLIFFVIYNFALWFTQSAAFILNSKKHQDDQQVVHDLQKYYGTVGQSIYTLFMSITNGISWGVCLQILFDCQDSVSVAMFCIYVAVCCFGLLNIVTSIFVESAMLSTQHYKDLLVEEKTFTNKTTTDHMKRIFQEIDSDGSGHISFLEMEKFLDTRGSELHTYFEALDLSVDDARAFFRLLDVDGSGVIDIDEFCDGCMRLKGEAKSFDLNCMIYEGRAMVRTWSEFMHFVEQEFTLLKGEWHTMAWSMNAILNSHDSHLKRLANINPSDGNGLSIDLDTLGSVGVGHASRLQTPRDALGGTEYAFRSQTPRAEYVTGSRVYGVTTPRSARPLSPLCTPKASDLRASGGGPVPPVQ